MATLAKPVITIAYNGNQWTIKSATPLKTMEIKFTEGVEFEEGNDFYLALSHSKVRQILAYKII